MQRWIALGCALLLAIAHGANLLAGAYGRYAERNLDRPGDPSVSEAAAIAVQLSPWSDHRLALAGWIAVEAEQPVAGDAYYRRALRWGPADPLLWAEYAQARTRSGDFDAVTLAATQRALYLAPTSAAVQRSIAALALSYWPRGTPDLHEVWQGAVRYELDHNRSNFLHQVLMRGQLAFFCAGPAERLGERRWCSAARRRLDACADSQGSGQNGSTCANDP